MHIPDGYLSPATCVVTYAVALPFWWLAFSRVKRLLQSRLLPMVALFSAFCFVVMMFNLPLPGGTTGHAVGMGIATIVMGPWASIVSISIALFIQALFFGDGGVTAFGANCFNMAIVGSFVAHWIYHLIAGKAPLPSTRRVVAAAIAGYVAINVAALVASIEFGIQPMFFHDASGTPLYAPYPLSIAVPAMMVGHLGFAGIAEMIITGGLFAYLQRANPELLGLADKWSTATGAFERAWYQTRKLWYGLAVLMLLSPLGLIAAGTAWGEWGAEDFANPEARQAIAVASHNMLPPAAAPQGLVRLSSVWQAPIPDYAPAFMHSANFGYILSALFGSGLILLVCLLVSAVLNRKPLA
jgi:cobalt/nickel transport system permease protein